MNLQITKVEARQDHKLYVKFKNGAARLFDMRPYLDKGVFKELKDESYLKKVRVIWGGVEWPHKQDLSSDTLYHRGISVKTRPRTSSAR